MKLILIILTFILCTKVNGQFTLSAGNGSKSENNNFKYSIDPKSEDRYNFNYLFVAGSYSFGKWLPNLRLTYIQKENVSAHFSQYVPSTPTESHYVESRDANVDFSYLGFRFGVDYRVLRTKNHRFKLYIGPFFQTDFRIYEHEDHHKYTFSDLTTYTSSIEEFDAMRVAPTFSAVGINLYPKFEFGHFFTGANISIGRNISDSRTFLLHNSPEFPEHKTWKSLREISLLIGYNFQSLKEMDQRSWYRPDTINKRWDLGFNIGINFASLRGDEYSMSSNYIYNGLGVQFGFIAEMKINSRFSLSSLTELTFNNSCYKNCTSIPSANFALHLHTMLSNGVNKPYFAIGPRYRRKISKNHETDYTSTNISYLKNDFALDFGFGFEFRRNWVKITPEIRYSLGLLNIVKDNNADLNFKSHMISLILGLK